jgi:hypothetical protein
MRAERLMADHFTSSGVGLAEFLERRGVRLD